LLKPREGLWRSSYHTCHIYHILGQIMTHMIDMIDMIGVYVSTFAM